MYETILSSQDELRRLPGLFRRWELAQVLDAGNDYRIEGAGTTSDGAPLFAIYKSTTADFLSPVQSEKEQSNVQA